MCLSHMPSKLLGHHYVVLSIFSCFLSFVLWLLRELVRVVFIGTHIQMKVSCTIVDWSDGCRTQCAFHFNRCSFIFIVYSIIQFLLYIIEIVFLIRLLIIFFFLLICAAHNMLLILLTFTSSSYQSIKASNHIYERKACISFSFKLKLALNLII